MWLKCMNSKFATDKNTEAKHWGEGCFRKTVEENGKTKNASIKNLPHHPMMFSCLNFKLKNSNPHQTTYPCICGKTKPRCRESLGFGYCENPQIAGFTLSWSSTDLEREREREREKLWSLLLFALDSTALKSRFHSLNSQKFSVPVSSFFLDFVGIACFRVFFRVFSSLPLLCSLWV